MGAMLRRLRSGSAAVFAAFMLATATTAPALPQTATPGAWLYGRAVLPADTFSDGPPSGAQLGTAPINGRTPPFPSQPVQGVSGLIDAGGGAYWALSDNGFGAKNNSADFLLRL